MPAPGSFAFADGSTAILRGHVARVIATFAARGVKSDPDYRMLHPNVRAHVDAGIAALEEAAAVWAANADAAQVGNVAMPTGGESVGSGSGEVGCGEAADLLGVQRRQVGNLARRYQLGPVPGRGRPWRLDRDLVIELAERRRQEGAQRGR